MHHIDKIRFIEKWYNVFEGNFNTDPWYLYKVYIFNKYFATYFFSSLLICFQCLEVTSTKLITLIEFELFKLYCLKNAFLFFLQCTPNELTNGVINACFLLLFKDLIRLFACYNDGIINLLGKYTLST